MALHKFEFGISKVFRALDWFLFFAFSLLSVFFMFQVLEQYISGKSGFSTSEQPITELPTITICFTMNGKYDGDTPKYQYNSDFKIEYFVDWEKSVGFLKEGRNINEFNETIYLEKILTKYSGTCYKVSAKLSATASFPFLKHKGKYTFIIIHFDKSISEKDLPRLRVFITSEKNAYGITMNAWRDGKANKFSVESNVFKQMDIEPVEFKYLKKLKSKCRSESFYECGAKILNDTMENCTAKCSPYTLPYFKICNTAQEIECADKFYSRLYQKLKTEADDSCPKPCTTLEFHGESTWLGNLSKYSNGTHGISYQFDSPQSVTVHEEYFIYNSISMIASVGGTLGMCIGFSFTNTVSCLISLAERLLK